MEILKRLDDTVLVVEFISDDVDSVGEFISQYCDLVIKGNKSDSFQWVIFLDLLELGFDGTENALLS